MVERGVIQVMEGRRCFSHLSIEDNLMTGAYTRKDGRPRWRPRSRRSTPTSRAEDAARRAGGLHLGRRAADVRDRPRADGPPKMVLLDEPVDGLAPQIVEEVFEIVKDLNTRDGVTFFSAEQNTNMALRYADYGYILENGRVVMDGAAAALRENEDVREFYLGTGARRRAQELSAT
jgi:branched-chain amino acid transport system ATP-binding protein